MSLMGNTTIRFDEEQAMLLEFARSFCADRGIDAAREHLEAPAEYPESLWQEIVAMGWTGIGLPESVGGSGLNMGAAVPVLESMGRALMGTPLLSSLLAAQLLSRADAEASESCLASIVGGEVATVAELESEDWGTDKIRAQLRSGRLHGQKRLVMDAASARWLVVVASCDGALVLAVVDATKLPTGAIRPRVMIDNTHRSADVTFDGVEVGLLIEGPAVRLALNDYRLLGSLLVAAESTGAAASCLDTMVDYLKTRKQFGKLIGSYQALKHPCVDILTAVDSSRSFIYHAAAIIGADHLGRDQEIACRMAKAQSTETLGHAGDRAVQFHGGMGFTWDCDAQLFIRRAQWARQQFGDAQHHRKRLAVLLLDT